MARRILKLEEKIWRDVDVLSPAVMFDSATNLICALYERLTPTIPHFSRGSPAGCSSKHICAKPPVGHIDVECMTEANVPRVHIPVRRNYGSIRGHEWRCQDDFQRFWREALNIEGFEEDRRWSYNCPSVHHPNVDTRSKPAVVMAAVSVAVLLGSGEDAG